MTDTAPPHESSSDDEQNPSSLYKIGAVARLTGIAPHNIRMWERRYQVVSPLRQDSKTRLYREEDVRKLTALKKLVDQGQAISTLASLSEEELLARLQPTTVSSPARPLHVLIICRFGNRFSRLAEAIAPNRLTLLTPEQSGAIEDSYDLVFMEIDRLREDTISTLHLMMDRAEPLRCLCIYRYGDRKLKSRLEGARLETVQGLLTEDLIHKEIERLTPRNEQIPFHEKLPSLTKRFTPKQLDQLARLSSEISCECPQHLAQLIRDLQAFEDYTLDCENKNADDAAFHARLNNTVGRARSAMEDALRDLIEFEALEGLVGIDTVDEL